MSGVVDPLTAAERSQGLLKSDLATGIMVFLGALCIWLLWENRRLSTEVRQLVAMCITHMEKSAAASVALTHAVQEKLTRRKPSVLGQEPTSQVEKVHGAAP